MRPTSYNIRVYGLLLNPLGQILLTDERRNGYLMTKFPGGGHELGESLEDGLKREFQEELGISIQLGQHFYTNEFLQISAFDPRQQLISIYFQVHFSNWKEILTSEKIFDFPDDNSDAQTFRWMEIMDLEDSQFTFPIDRIVCQRLQNAQALW